MKEAQDLQVKQEKKVRLESGTHLCQTPLEVLEALQIETSSLTNKTAWSPPGSFLGHDKGSGVIWNREGTLSRIYMASGNRIHPHAGQGRTTRGADFVQWKGKWSHT